MMLTAIVISCCHCCDCAGYDYDDDYCGEDYRDAWLYDDDAHHDVPHGYSGTPHQMCYYQLKYYPRRGSPYAIWQSWISSAVT